MKKFTLLATMALAAVSANAQYTSDATTEAISNANPKAYFDIVAMQDACIDKLAAAGHKVQAVGPNNELRNLWYWEGTVDNTAVPATPGIGWNDTELNFDGAVSVEITGAANWSGLGYAIDPAETPADGVDFTHFTEKTRFHAGFMTVGTAPASLGVTILDDDKNGCPPAKLAVGDPFNDNGVIFPSIAPKINEDWQCVDISFSDIMKIYPQFNYIVDKKQNWKGNVMAMLGGAVKGQSWAWDAVYFYTPGEDDGVEGIVADRFDIVYTGRTINASGASSIALYDMSGKAVKRSNSAILGTDGVAPGIYVVKAGNSVAKIVVR